MATAPREPEPPRQLWLDVDRPILTRPRRPRAPACDAPAQILPNRQMELRMAPAPAPVKPILKVAPRPSVQAIPTSVAPARQPFGAWLLNQGKGPGLIGELAKAVKLDRAFPKNGTVDEVRRRFALVGADGDAFEALDDAEREYDRQP